MDHGTANLRSDCAHAGHRRQPVRPSRRFRGFTLVELLVVITVIGLLVAILLPAMGAARDAARNSTCKSNLRQFGVGLHSYAESHGDRFCSGAFNWKTDGAVTEVGWVADMVNQNILAGQMLCPSNSARLSQTYEDLLGMDASAPTPCVDWLGSQPGTWPDGSPKINPCRELAAMAANSEARRELIEKQILKKWYNTNYAASWFLVRSGVSLNANGNLVANPATCPASNISRNSTLGPLTRRMTDAGATSTSNIPVLGDAAPNPQSRLGQTLWNYSVGEPLAYAMTDGPVLNTTMAPPTFPAGTPHGGASGWWGTWANKTLQDYRKFGAVHGGGNSASCNILFADGSTRTFVDANGDGTLNNGFDPAVATGNIGIIDNSVELPVEEIYSGWSLRSDMKGR